MRRRELKLEAVRNMKLVKRTVNEFGDQVKVRASHCMQNERSSPSWLEPGSLGALTVSYQMYKALPREDIMQQKPPTPMSKLSFPYRTMMGKTW